MGKDVRNIIKTSKAAAKLDYGLHIGQLFCYVFPEPSAMERFGSASLSYLDRVSYLVVGA